MYMHYSTCVHIRTYIYVNVEKKRNAHSDANMLTLYVVYNFIF